MEQGMVLCGGPQAGSRCGGICASRLTPACTWQPRPSRSQVKQRSGREGVLGRLPAQHEFLDAQLFMDLNEQRLECLQTLGETENDMEQALMPAQIIFYLMGGLGLFFLGVGVLWFVDIYKKKNE